jgi:transcriptional regulator with XRE-family HTH domain
MADGQGPATTRRRLRFELRRIREESGLGQSEVVKKLEWSLSKLIRIENGSVGISITDLRALLGVYRCSEAVIDDLVDLARTARERRWWSGYGDVLNPQYQEFIGLEADATRLRQCHPAIVPGLLQIESYMRALIPALMPSPVSESRCNGLVEVRLRRQKEILEGEGATEFTAVIDEAALRRPVGGPEVMRAQLEHLAEIGSHDTVTIGVLPFSAGPHIGMLGAFHIMEFAHKADDNVLYFEGAQGAFTLREQPALVARYTEHLDHMLEISLRGNAAADLIRNLAKEFA